MSQVRPFISSSFKDMSEEREELLTRSFPPAHRLCHQRGLFFFPVDLRWGITESASEDGRVIDLCLQEVDRSRPYFLGILGNRYGWYQDPGKPGDPLLEKSFLLAEIRFPWLKEFRDRSVTELEIIYGAFMAPPEHRSRILFYFREPESEPESTTPATHALLKMQQLKRRIQDEGFNVKIYQTPEQLGELVAKDLVELIERDFPSKVSSSPFDHEAQSQASFAASRAQVYVANKQLYDQLDDFVLNSGSEKPLMIIGSSGGGKTSLVANYCLSLRKKQPGIFVLPFFIGSTPQSSSHLYLLQYLLQALKRHLGLEDPVPTDPAQLTRTLEIWLQRLALAAEAGAPKVSMVLVLDALNQLDSDGNAHELTWLPVTFPKHVRVIVSTLPGRCLDVLNERALSSVVVNPLQGQEKEQVVSEYLRQYSKTLSEEQLAAVVAAPQTGNALFLRVFLDELRISADFEGLDKMIETYLQGADTVEKLFEMVLHRWEEDYGEVVVRKALSFLSVSYAGLSEAELMALLSVSQHRLSPLILASQEVIISKSKGLMGFFHDNLRIAVKSRYLSVPGSEESLRSELVGYFEALADDQDEPFERKITELPYQYVKKGETGKLTGFISQQRVFLTLSSTARRAELMKHWRAAGGYDASVAPYLNLVHKAKDLASSNPAEGSRSIELVEAVGLFFTEVGKYTEAVQVFRDAISLEEKLSEAESLHLASLLFKLSTAMDYLCIDWSPETQRGLLIAEKHQGPNHVDLVVPLVSAAYHAYRPSTFAKTMEDLGRALEIISPHQSKHPETFLYVHVTYGQVYLNQKMLEQSMASYQLVLDLAPSTLGPRHKFIGFALRGIGTCHRKWDKLEEAATFLKRSVDFNVEAVGPEHPDTATCLFDYGNLLREMKNPSEALGFLERSLRIRESVFGVNSKKAANTWAAQARCWRDLKEKEQMDRCQEKYVQIMATYENES